MAIYWNTDTDTADTVGESDKNMEKKNPAMEPKFINPFDPNSMAISPVLTRDKLEYIRRIEEENKWLQKENKRLEEMIKEYRDSTKMLLAANKELERQRDNALGFNTPAQDSVKPTRKQPEDTKKMQDRLDELAKKLEI